LILAATTSLAVGGTRAISDVRFDGPYSQVEFSLGDEWAPTWGRNDVLYTGSDDGVSFGGIPARAVAFGRLEGNDPQRLKGTTVSAMDGFKEPYASRSEDTVWEAKTPYVIKGSRYQFDSCADGTSTAQCLEESFDDGKSWVRSGGAIGAIGGGRAIPIFSSTDGPAVFIEFRKPMEAILGGTVGRYAYAVAPMGDVDGVANYLLGRVLKDKLGQGNSTDWSFLRSDDTTWHDDIRDAAPMPNNLGLGMGLGPDHANWKATNTYSVGGVLYMFLARCHYPWVLADSKGRHRFENSTIVRSTDEGRTWSPAGQQALSRPMFPGTRFGAPYFVWYGKDGEAHADNADRYVYAVSNDGFFEGGDNYVLGRVLKKNLARLSAADWSFYKSGDGLKRRNWTYRLSAARPILSDVGQSGMTGMTYMEGLHRYVMIVWHYPGIGFLKAIEDRDLSTVLEFFESPTPWGPWTRFKILDTGPLGWYAPVIGQRFQKSVDSGTVTAVVYAAGYRSYPSGGLDPERYRLNSIPITLSIRPLPRQNPAFVDSH